MGSIIPFNDDHVQKVSGPKDHIMDGGYTKMKKVYISS